MAQVTSSMAKKNALGTTAAIANTTNTSVRKKRVPRSSVTKPARKATANTSARKKKPARNADLLGIELAAVSGKFIAVPANHSGVTTITAKHPASTWVCPICTDRFTRDRSLKDHFVDVCVPANGNPHPVTWDFASPNGTNVRSAGIKSRA